MQAQLDGYRAAFRHLPRTETFDNGARWVFAREPGLDAALRSLAVREHQGCSFFKFDLRVQDDTIVWETTANAGAAAVLEEYARLPARFADHAQGAEVARIKSAISNAGLRFAADVSATK